jgi:BirA family biotin operon repressor/biotin-[acetyl-CoA-carboxylase] ligase
VSWSVTRIASTGSTNADLLVAAHAGAPHGTVLVADEQTAGRGRLGRRWVTPPGSALALSVVLRPRARPGCWTWIPLLTGLAVVDAVAALAPGLAVWLKWPNDVLVTAPDGNRSDGERKLAGVLVERADSAVVVGIGLNVSVAAVDFPVDAIATSLLAAGASGPALDREQVLGVLLGALAGRFARWDVAADSLDPSGGLAAEYRARCSTVGRVVRVDLGGDHVEGTAVDIAPDGALVVAPPGAAPVTVRAGDVRHLRVRSAARHEPG